MKSVVLNNTLQEDWDVAPDSAGQWSHCAVAPIYALFMDIAGIRPTAPGFTRCQIRPQLADLKDLDLTYYTVRGPMRFVAQHRPDGHHVAVQIPSGCQAELLLPDGRGIKFPALKPDHPLGLKRFQLKSGQGNEFSVR
jgi:hypothetical protein